MRNMNFEEWWKSNKYDPVIPRTFYDYSKHAWDAAEKESRAKYAKMEKEFRHLIDIYCVADEYKGERRVILIERYFKMYVGE